ncbi:hypothetical protein Tco_0135103 [Tanacetum coccineum]
MVAANTKKTPRESASVQPATKRATPKKPTTTTPVKQSKPAPPPTKKKRTTDQFVFARRDQTPPDSTTGPSSQPEDDTSEKVMDECHKLLTNKVDWSNPEGHQILRNIYEPLPLGGPPGQVTIQPQFFFNKDLDYLLTGDKERKIALSISKLKAARYLDFGLEELVPSLWVESEREYDISAVYGITHWWFRRKEFYINKHSESSDREAVRSQMRILSVISVKVFEKYGYNYLREIILRRADYQEYKISEKDFKNLHPNDFEDLFLLNIQEKLNHLPKTDKISLHTAVNMWMRNLGLKNKKELYENKGCKERSPPFSYADTGSNHIAFRNTKMIADNEDRQHGPSDQMHNPPTTQKSLKRFLFHFSQRLNTLSIELSHSELVDIEKDTYPILLSFTHCGNKSFLRVLRIILVILPEHPSETIVVHNEDGNPARANIKLALGYLKDGDGDGNSQPHKGVKASANSDVIAFFTRQQYAIHPR